jgi:hypothetical protein
MKTYFTCEESNCFHCLLLSRKLIHYNKFKYDACDVTLSVYPHRASLKNMPDHGGIRTYDLWNTIPPWSGIFFKLARCGYTLRVTSQASYSPEYIAPTQKNQNLNTLSISKTRTIPCTLLVLGYWQQNEYATNGSKVTKFTS